MILLALGVDSHWKGDCFITKLNHLAFSVDLACALLCSAHINTKTHLHTVYSLLLFNRLQPADAIVKALVNIVTKEMYLLVCIIIIIIHNICASDIGLKTSISNVLQ